MIAIVFLSLIIFISLFIGCSFPAFEGFSSLDQPVSGPKNNSSINSNNDLSGAPTIDDELKPELSLGSPSYNKIIQQGPTSLPASKQTASAAPFTPSPIPPSGSCETLKNTIELLSANQSANQKNIMGLKQIQSALHCQ